MMKISEKALEKTEKALEKMKARLTLETCMARLRSGLIIPYLRNSSEAKACGWKIDDDGVLTRTVETSMDDCIFPGGTALIEAYDTSRVCVLTSNISANDDEMNKERELSMTVDNSAALVLYSNWRFACARYLSKLAQDFEEAAKMLVEDKTPFRFISAILALSLLNSGNISQENANELALIVKTWEFLHQ